MQTQRVRGWGWRGNGHGTACPPLPFSPVLNICAPVSRHPHEFQLAPQAPKPNQAGSSRLAGINGFLDGFRKIPSYGFLRALVHPGARGGSIPTPNAPASGPGPAPGPLGTAPSRDDAAHDVMGHMGGVAGVPGSLGGGGVEVGNGTGASSSYGRLDGSLRAAGLGAAGVGGHVTFAPAGAGAAGGGAAGVRAQRAALFGSADWSGSGGSEGRSGGGRSPAAL